MDPRYWKKIGAGLWQRNETPVPPLPAEEQRRLDDILARLSQRLQALVAEAQARRDSVRGRGRPAEAPVFGSASI